MDSTFGYICTEVGLTDRRTCALGDRLETPTEDRRARTEERGSKVTTR